MNDDTPCQRGYIAPDGKSLCTQTGEHETHMAVSPAGIIINTWVDGDGYEFDADDPVH